MVQAGGSFGLKEFKEALKQKIDPHPILGKLEQLKVVVPSYKGEEYYEWKMLEETLPFIRSELGIPSVEYKPATAPSAGASPGEVAEKADYLEDERRKTEGMDEELNSYLNDLIKNRLGKTIKFGKTFSASFLADYLQSLFGQ